VRAKMTFHLASTVADVLTDALSDTTSGGGEAVRSPGVIGDDGSELPAVA
jgi:hypothetical protein